MLLYYDEVVEVGMSMIDLKKVVRSLWIDWEGSCDDSKECEW